jgi:hypothetical protein
MCTFVQSRAYRAAASGLGFAALDGKHFLMRALFLVTAVLLTVDPVTAQEQDRAIGTTGSESQVVVAPVANEASAMRDAERHCRRYNRYANFRRMDGAKATFDCGLVKIEPRGGTGGLY